MTLTARVAECSFRYRAIAFGWFASICRATCAITGPSRRLSSMAEIATAAALVAGVA